ncbi:MAG TPA: cysteine dioxygenase family protein [Phycisphaerales bacterium]|nr:cysteine dioxygenase family protein [Phycisphaerales bacterium]
MSATSPTAPSKDACKATSVCEKLRPIIAYLDSLSGRADLKVLEGMLQKLDITIEDIRSNCIFGERGYKRNTISRSEWYELLALCWHSGDRTPIHDHQGVSCAFKVVHGTGTEIRFRPTPSGLICPAATIEMRPGYICSADDADIHEVANFQGPGQDLVTLHIYSPPIKKMNVYSFTCPAPQECADAYKDTPC